jgi:hypothetical protein
VSAAGAAVLAPRATEADRPPVRQVAVRAAAAVCVAAAGVIHLWVAPEHFGEALRLGLFFVVLGVAQLGFAVALRAALQTWVIVAAVLAHLAVITLYVATRTADLPFVPVHEHIAHVPIARTVGNGIPVFPGSRIEEVGTLDMVCLGAELGAVVLLVALLPRRAGKAMTDLMLALGLLALLLRGVGVLS